MRGTQRAAGGRTVPDGVAAAANEAWYRARRAGDALAGRREPPRLALLVGLTAAGVIAGWLAAMSTRRALALIVNQAIQDERPYGDDRTLPDI